MSRSVFADRLAQLPASGVVILRHGHSQGNERGIIVSDPQTGTVEYGLTERGRREAVRSAEQLQRLVRPDRTEAAASVTPIRIVASDFRRTRETAEVFGQYLDAEVLVDERLRERFFGTLDGSSNRAYQRVWERDARDPSHRTWGVESVEQVARRTLAVFEDWKDRHAAGITLFVSHGDPLQILHTAVHGRPLNCHREGPEIRTAELRVLENAAAPELSPGAVGRREGA